MRKVRTLQDRMADMKPYFRGIEMYNEALIVKVAYPSKWRTYDSEDGRIRATPSETVANEFFYYANSEDATYDDIFDLVEETIKVNSDMVLKVKLLREKGEELKELFSRLPYEELRTLRFVTGDDSAARPKRKYTRRKKASGEAENASQDDVTEDIVKEAE